MAKQFALLLAIVLTSGVTLHGHAELVRTDPPGDAVLEAGPVALRLWFSEPVDAPADAIVIIDPTGTRVDLNDARPAADDAMALGVSLRANAHGTYVVRWRAISADSHPISGSFVFSVGTPGPPAESVLDGQSTTSPLLIVGQAIVRWAHLLALSLIWGPVVLWHLFEPPWQHSAVPSRLWLLVTAGAVLLLLATAAALPVQAIAVDGSARGGLSRPSLAALLATRWGMLWQLRALLSLATAATALAVRRVGDAAPVERRLRTPVTIIGVAFLAVTVMNGHAAATPPVWLSLAVDGFHLVATTVWIGGLFCLASVILPAARRAGSGRPLPLSSLVRRFSALAIGCVTVLGATGAYQAWSHVNSLQAALATGYGRTLLVKLGLTCVMLLPAAFHLFVVRRWHIDDDGAGPETRRRRFQRTLALEGAIGVAVLASVGLLTSLSPAAARQGERGDSEAAKAPVVTLHQQSSRMHVTLDLSPGRVGSNRVEARVTELSGQRFANAEVRFRVLPPEASQLTPWTVVPAAEGSTYRATVALVPAGRWRLAVSVSRGQGVTDSVEFEIPLSAAGS